MEEFIPLNYKPYIEHKLNNGGILRTFSKDVVSEELVWHRDKKNRIVTVIEGEGWEIQMDDQLPRPLIKGEEYVIPAYIFHRIKRGATDLVLRIEEH